MNHDVSRGPDDTAAHPVAFSLLAIRGVIGGIMMGLANLVPGISGGTMLLASGVYPRFIQAIAEVTSFKFRKSSLVVLMAVGGSAGLAILLLAGMVKGLVVDHRWIMYSLFIGLTLGGVPVVWKLASPATPALWVGAAFGFVSMAIVAWLQASEAGAGDVENHGWIMMFVAGLVGAAAMILPGISGGYILLVLGQYVFILSAIDQTKDALHARDWVALGDVVMAVIVPVGLGVVLGIVGVSHALRFLLQRFEKLTLGSLIGLLFGAVVGLWPFQQAVKPQVGGMFKGQLVTDELLQTLKPEKYPNEYFTPDAGQVAVAIGVIVAGFILTALIARFGKEESV